jgi:Mlc titration factor MtfA (ptsG expression regulator)
MFGFIRQWLNRRIINRSTITPDEWERAFAALPLLKGLGEDELQRLKELAILLMHEKSFEGAQGLVLSRPMILHIALQACLPILYLGIDAYDGWSSVIVYPAAFIPKRTFTDEMGVVHEGRSVLAGEAWQRGPVILGWQKVESAGEVDGENVVIHEFAHKLDMLNGVANGFPPLHSGVEAEGWVETFTAAFQDFQNQCDKLDYHQIDCYAATSPPEFFAVFTEVFFEQPALLKHHYPAVYEQLGRYYRQDPATRIGRAGRD